MSKSKVVSVSLFGQERRYLVGAIKLTKSVKANLPGWEIVFFTGRSVPTEVTKRLQSLGAKIVSVIDKENLSATSWRFRIEHLEKPGWVIFRDSDSIVSKREARAIYQWVKSGCLGHIIRDHPFHSAKILAGLWGLRPDGAEWFSREVDSYNFQDSYGTDQQFLAERIYPLISDKCLIHASFHQHEKESSLEKFEIGSSRLGQFCGESVTDSFIVRIYARLRRLVDSKTCRCDT